MSLSKKIIGQYRIQKNNLPYLNTELNTVFIDTIMYNDEVRAQEPGDTTFKRRMFPNIYSALKSN